MKRSDESTREEARNLYARGISSRKIAEKLGYSPSTILRWVNRFGSEYAS